MTKNGNGAPPVMVVVQLSGGNDFMNTVIPFDNPVYHDSRPTVSIQAGDVLPLDDTLGWHPSMGPMKEMYDAGKVAVVQGVGYENSSRSHFRAMDIMHTCTPGERGNGGLGSQGCARDGPAQGECSDLRQLRTRPPTRDGRARRAGSLGRRSRELRPDDRDR